MSIDSAGWLLKNNKFNVIDKFKVSNGEPKYKQIADAIIQGVKNHQLLRDDKLPSINEMCSYYTISKATVQKSYELLKRKGIIKSVHGKGFTICGGGCTGGVNVFVMFDALNSFKEELYNGIRDTIKSLSSESSYIDIHFHHFNDEHFVQYLESNLDKYEYYVVMPYESSKIKNILNKLDLDKLLILDRADEYLGEGAAIIAQDHDVELTKALLHGKESIQKYSNFVLCFPENRFNPNVIKHGYKVFCKNAGYEVTIIDNIKTGDIKKDTAYLVIEDFNLVTLVSTAKEKGFVIGRDIGILSYNDTPLKKIIEEGVSVVSIDFYKMGALVAEQILNRNIKYKLVPTELILRNTL